jgi:predicted permease
MGWLRRLRGTLIGSSVDVTVDEEVLFHIDALTDEYVRTGMTSADARRTAERRVGNPTRIRECTRDVDMLRWVRDGARDARFAVRMLEKNPGFTIVAILTLALCIGANTAIYTVVDRVLLRALPYPHPESLAEVVTHFEGHNTDEIGQTGAMWEALAHGVSSVDLAVTSGSAASGREGFGSTGVNLLVGDHPEYVMEERVSAGYFRVLGVEPAVGRELSADEDRAGGPSATVISYGLWQRLFEGDGAAIGRTVTLRGTPSTIVGVAPAGFGEGVDVWTPVRASRTGEGGGNNYEIIARLNPGVSWPQADAEIAAAGASALHPERMPNDPPREHVVPLQLSQTGGVRQPILILWSAVGLVLVIGCVNVAGLLIARGAVRAPEIATRIALGGGRGAIVRQLLVESAALASCGGLAGILVGQVGTQLFASLLKDAFGITQTIALDARVYAMSALGALATSLVFGLVPALQAIRVDLRHVLVESGSPSIAGTARRWPRRILVVTEVALGVLLLVGAGLLIRTVDRLTSLRAGFDGTHVVTGSLSLEDARYRAVDQVNLLIDRSLAQMRAIPGVEHAAVALTLPYERALNLGGRWVGAAPGRDTIGIMNLTYVSPEYFDTLRIPVMRGRALAVTDTRTGEPVIVVNQAFVARYAHDEDVLGRQIVVVGQPRTVVGIVGDIQQRAGWGEFGPVAPMPATYIPAAQTNDAFLTMVHAWFSPSWFVRTPGPQTDVATAMQRVVLSVDPTLPFAKFRTMDDVRTEAVAPQRARAALLGGLAGLALLLASVGLYGLVANSVVERTRELGIRIALGATASRIVRDAAVPGIALASVGIAIGLLAARVSANALVHLVWGVSTADPLTFITAAGIVFAVATVAAIVPTGQILRLNLISALRT